MTKLEFNDSLGHGNKFGLQDLLGAFWIVLSARAASAKAQLAPAVRSHAKPLELSTKSSGDESTPKTHKNNSTEARS